jgi:TetR/AcrR family transcriptional repressor of nem operon
LDKRDDDLSRRTCSPLLLLVDWAEQRFREMGRSDARDLAIGLISSYDGISLLANTIRDSRLVARQARRLSRWIDELAT